MKSLALDDISTLLSFYAGTGRRAAYNDSPYRNIPCDLLTAFTLNHRVPVLSDPQYCWRDDSTPLKSKWTHAYISKFVKRFTPANVRARREGPSPYGHGSAARLLAACERHDIRGMRVAVVGSETPWIEAMLLNLGNTVTTIEYNVPDCAHFEGLQCRGYFEHFAQYSAAEAKGDGGRYDAVVTFSSIEHSGLGRYGDPLDPDGDIETMRAIHRNLRPGGLLLWGGPVGADALVWNAHRIYGPLRLPLLFGLRKRAGVDADACASASADAACPGIHARRPDDDYCFEEVYWAEDKQQLFGAPLARKAFQPVVVLRKAEVPTANANANTNGNANANADINADKDSEAGINANAGADAGAKSSMSNKARKRAARKARRAAAKAAAAKAAQSAAELLSEQQRRNLHERQLQERGLSGLAGHAAGKSGRAREARLEAAACVGSASDAGTDASSRCQNRAPGRATHRARGGAPVAVDAAHRDVVELLEDVESSARRRARPHLVQRAPIPMDCHGSMEATPASSVMVTAAVAAAAPATAGATMSQGVCSLRNNNLRAFELSLLPTTHTGGSYSSVTELDISRNELWAAPGLDELLALKRLNLSRNWFEELPVQLESLRALQVLDASYNLLKPACDALRLAALKSLPALAHFDISCNQKCGRKPNLIAKLRCELPAVEVRATVAFDRTAAPVEGAFEGASPAQRDATALRAQLEPWNTAALRRRLVADFGDAPSDPEAVHRAEVMRRLLAKYDEEGGVGSRRLVHVLGTPIATETRTDLLKELHAWASSLASSGASRERPSVSASSYMILRAPAEFTVGSTKALKAAAKLAKYRRLWDLAQSAMSQVDADFAARFTALAVTHGFRGSPHIDKQNVGPFYGLALGDFEDGTGGICVECSARVVAVVNTRNRLGKVDGRYPHWVAPYDTTRERFSLIYYQTAGEVLPVGPAIFTMPHKT